MASIRPFLLAAAVAALPLTFVACGGDDGGSDIVTPEGDHYQTVAKQAFVPTTPGEARDYGLDIGSSDGSGPDGAVDNQLGSALGTLASMGFDLQGTIDQAVAEGSIILLVDFQTTDLANSKAAGLNVLLGDKATAMPAPCNVDEMYDKDAGTGCGHHLDGTGVFTLAASSPDNAAVAGKIVNGVFNGGPGNISLQIAIGSTEPLTLDLIGARAKATGITADAIESAILAGAVSQDDINNKILPAIQQQLGPIIAETCTDLASPPECGCTAGTGKTIIDLFDTDQDCMVSVSELTSNSLIQSLLGPDVTIDGVKALSIGIKVSTTKASFPDQQ
jgi:hypothetical protein